MASTNSEPEVPDYEVPAQWQPEAWGGYARYSLDGLMLGTVAPRGEGWVAAHIDRRIQLGSQLVQVADGAELPSAVEAVEAAIQAAAR